MNDTVSQFGGDVQTQLAAMEAHLADVQRQLQHLQRLASLGTISAMLAHEFNNVLTPIVSYSQYALGQNDPQLMRTALEKTLKNAARLSDLCKRVLGMATDRQMGPADEAIEPLVREAVECLGRDLGKDNITLTIDVPAGLTAHVHAGGLQQVLFNLVLNARQAMLDRPGALRIAARDAGDGRIEIDVADTGPGIRPEHVERIFDPFFTTKQQAERSDRRGAGLGLSICLRIMHDLGGAIRAASTFGKGSTFTLTLPAGRG